MRTSNRAPSIRKGLWDPSSRYASHRRMLTAETGRTPWPLTCARGQTRKRTTLFMSMCRQRLKSASSPACRNSSGRRPDMVLDLYTEYRDSFMHDIQDLETRFILATSFHRLGHADQARGMFISCIENRHPEVRKPCTPVCHRSCAGRLCRRPEMEHPISRIIPPGKTPLS